MAIQQIDNIFEGYFQKSKAFLHPVLGHKKGMCVIPIDTYMCGEDIHVSECKLMCLYHLRDDKEFLIFEEKYLLGNPFFEDFKETEDGKGLYIFNLEDYKEDYMHILHGRYSQLSDETKKKIKSYHMESSAAYAFMHTYLFPDNYYDQYAKFLCVNKKDVPEMRDIVANVGELCDPPNSNKELLKMSVKTLKVTQL